MRRLTKCETEIVIGDPYWTTSFGHGICRTCGKPIEKGNQIYYYPIGKHTYCYECGMIEYKRFVEETDGLR